MNDLGEPLSEEETQQTLDEIAEVIVRRRLVAPAIMFLEMHKPLSFIAGQGMIVAMPLIGPLLGPERMSRLSRLLQDRENIERLIQRIEERSDE